MKSGTSSRYCADPDAIALLARDGMGWGHDLDCGCFRTEERVAANARPSILRRLFGKGGAR